MLNHLGVIRQIMPQVRCKVRCWRGRTYLSGLLHNVLVPPAPPGSLQLGRGICRWCTVLGTGQGGLAKMLMGPEKAFSRGRKAGEASWKGMIGWKDEFR